MAVLNNAINFFAIVMLSQATIALPEPQVTPAPAYKHSCYSYTVTTPYTGPVNCPIIPVHCPPHPDCIVLERKTTTVPCSDKKCPITRTVTVTGPGVCPTCQTGCGTEVVTVTATSAGCV